MIRIFEKIRKIKVIAKYRKVIVAAIFIVAFIFLFLCFAPLGTAKLEYKILAPEYIISSVYKVYGNSNTGVWASKIVMTNNGTSPARDLKISYKIEGYSEWSEPKAYPVLLPGSTIVDLYYPILSSEIMKLKTSAPSNIKIKISYSDSHLGGIKQIDETKSISLLGGHDIIFSSIPPEESTGDFYDIFSNYSLISAWVTPTDPVLMRFADMGNKLAGGAGASLSDEEAVKSLAGIWQVAVNNGVEYKTEPAAYWTGKFSQFVKYPRDVIKDRAGTCLDTAIFFASAASSQGLKPYVIMMPGHAFPVIALPSGQIIPIESTALNNKVSFEEAIQAGSETYNKAMAGPFVVVDVESFQSLGIIPPELEELPTDVLEKWGISMRGSGGGGGTSPKPSPGPSVPSQANTSYTNSFPQWRISYPANWTTIPASSEVDFYSPAKDVEFIVTWGYGLSASAVRGIVELYLLAPRGAQSTGESQDSAGGATATKVSYQATISGRPYILVARYFESQNHGLAILYDFPSDTNYQSNLNTCETIFRSFSI